MLLALRSDAPVGANWLQRLFCWLIRNRLVSMWCHGGIVIDGVLYHSTILRGPHTLQPGEWAPTHWDLFDMGGDDDKARELFAIACQPPENKFARIIWKFTKGYDIFSLIAFVGPNIRVSWLHYCFELCHLMYTGTFPVKRITPEILLFSIYSKKNETNY